MDADRAGASLSLDQLVARFVAIGEAMAATIAMDLPHLREEPARFAAALARAPDAGYHALAAPLNSLFQTGGRSPAENALCVRGMLCRLVADKAASGAYAPVTENLHRQFLDRLDHVHHNLLTRDQDFFSRVNDRLLKDLGVALGVLISCRLVLFERNAIPRRGRLSDPRLILMLLRLGGREPLLEGHLDMEYIAEFSEAGWRHANLLLAEYLRRHPDLRGMFGASWYYDPQIEHLAPHLSYLAGARLAEGSRHFRVPPTQGHIANALATSKTRRALYEQGRYRPRPRMLVWPAREILAWADKELAREQTRA